MSDSLKDDLRAKLTARGIEFDGRWGVEALERALAAAETSEDDMAQRDAKTAAEDDGLIEVRILKFAFVENRDTGKRPARISKGDGTFVKAPGETIRVSLEAAEALEARGYGEIV